MRTVHRTIVSPLIFSADGKFLLVRQADDLRRPYPGCWGLPGGGMDEGEDFRATLNRETMEELAFDISSYSAELVNEWEGEAEKTLRQTGERVWCKMQFFDYKVVIDDQLADKIKLQPNDEHGAYKWYLPSEIKTIKLTPPSVALFTKLGYV